YVVESDLEEDPEEYEDDETKDGPVDYPMDGGDDGDDDDDDSSGDDADNIGIRAKVIENQYTYTSLYYGYRIAMSSDNASSTVTYTSVSSDSNGPSSWGISLVNAGEIPELDPYEEPYADDASPIAESPGYIADSNSMEDDTDTDSIDYPDEPVTSDEDPEDEDPEEDPSEEHDPEDDDEDPEEDPSKEHEPEDEDAKEDEPFEDSDETEPAWKTVRPEPPMPVSMEARIVEHAAAPIPPTSPTYDQAPLGHRAVMIRMRNDIPEEDMPPRRRFVLTAPSPGYDVAESYVVAATRAPRG
ncbi:hypothetical protein Tco_1527044, partial [Tanacetum coccineum]